MDFQLAVTVFLVSLPCLVAVTPSTYESGPAKFTRFSCVIHDTDVLAPNYTCSLKAISRNKTIINLRANFTRQVNVITAHIQVFKKLNHIYKPFLVNVKENFCHLFTKESSTPYLKIFYNIAARYTNFNHSCPYKGEVIIKDLPMDADKLRLPMPLGEYRLTLSPIADNSRTPFATLQVFLEFGEMNFQ